MISIVGWLWKPAQGKPIYTAEHVKVWAQMIHRNLTMPHQFVIVTDTPGDDFGPLVKPLPLWELSAPITPNWGTFKVNCYRRLKAYSIEFGDMLAELGAPRRFVSVDLDLVVLGNQDATKREPFLDSIFDRSEEFVILKRFLGNGARPKNWCQGSMWLMNAGARRQVWETFEGQRSVDMTNGLIGTDQAWVAFTLPPTEAGWTQHDGVVCWADLHSNWERYDREPPPVKMIFFNCNPKQDELAKTKNFRWIADFYR